MNRYDYYTRCTSVDEQEWLTEELYYPGGDDRIHYSDDWEDCYDSDNIWDTCEEDDQWEEEDDWEEDDWQEEN